MPFSLIELNQMPQAEFVATLGGIFEHTPQIAAQVWYQAPFATVVELHQKMVSVVSQFDQAEKLALIQAHPDLGSRVKMAEASVQEQSGVGLDRLTQEEYHLFQSLNQAYREKFGFPFIIAVRNHTKDTILQAFQERLKHSKESELAQALAEISEIARFRLFGLLGEL